MVDSPRGLNFRPGSGLVDGLVAPADFSAPKPKAVRMGDGSVLKVGRPRGFWKSVLGPDATPTLEAIAKAMNAMPEWFSKDEHAAMARKLKSRGDVRPTPFPLARQRNNDAWLAGV
jgi:hypothetical protein